MNEYEEIGYWLSGYIDAILVVLDDNREGIMATAQLLRELPRAFHIRFSEKKESEKE